MAKVFLDTNIFIDAVHRRPDINDEFITHDIYHSYLSTHILYYAQKLKVSNPATQVTGEKFQGVELTTSIMEHALIGPTRDLEDNIQLHSAAEADCDYFLTSDKKLLTMTYFGKTKMVSTIPKPNTR
jgi:predicted nucleic acid-binding protein